MVLQTFTLPTLMRFVKNTVVSCAYATDTVAVRFVLLDDTRAPDGIVVIPVTSKFEFMTSETVWLPTLTRAPCVHVPAGTLMIPPPSIRNWNVGCVFRPATRFLQISSRPLAVFVNVAVLIPDVSVIELGPELSMKSPGFRSE